MNRDKLDPEERQILDEVERGEWVSVMTPQSKERARLAAEQTLIEGEERVSVTVSARDFWELQRQAKDEGRSYESLVAAILHKYVSGDLVDAAMQNSPAGQDQTT